MLNDIGLAVAATLDMDRMLRTLYEQCQQIGEFECFYVGLYDEAQGKVHFPIFYDRGEFVQIPDFDVRDHRCLTCHVIRERQTFYIPDTLDIDPVLDVEPAQLTDAPVRSYLAVPLFQHDRVIGMISIQSLDVEAYTAEQIRLLETVAIPAAIAIQNSQLYTQAQDEIVRRRHAQESLSQVNERLQAHLVQIEALQAELREQAIRDPLTNLFNRRYLRETLERELARVDRRGDPLSLVMIDIDRFKNLNDTHGHKAGDLVLQALAAMLQSHSRQEDIVCRYGGEEFLVVMPGMSMQAAERRAEGWRTAFEDLVVEYGDLRLCSTISLGVAAFPDHGSDGEMLVDIVDRALYAAKTAGRNCTVIWGE
jgi:diguanylate cyclase (GGDEF)-like protein